VPILEPEVDINSPEKAEAEALLRDGLLAGLESAPRRPAGHVQADAAGQDDFYRELSTTRVLKVVALSGGYSRDEANARLARNPGVVASFSRALTEGLSAQQSDAEFDATLDEAIQSIYEASVA
jgi:fructose-bisphosphate aldolase, class I